MHDTDTFSFTASVAHHRAIGKTLFLSSGLHVLLMGLAAWVVLPTDPWSTGSLRDPVVIVAIYTEAGVQRPPALDDSPTPKKNVPLRPAETPAQTQSNQLNVAPVIPSALPNQALQTLVTSPVKPNTVDHASSTPPLVAGNAAAPTTTTTTTTTTATTTTNSDAPVAAFKPSPNASPASEANNQPPISYASYLNNPPPPYPAQSRRLGEQGTAKWSVLIGTDGKASEATLVQSSGYSRLDDAAKTAVLSWRYVPGRRGGVALPMFVIVPVTFNVGQL